MAISRGRAGFRPSTVDKLDPEIKRLIAQLRIEHGWTIDQILAKLIELNAPVSRSALARHTRSLAEIGEQLRHSREMAKALVESVGDQPETRLADLNIELLHTMVLRFLTSEGELTLSAEDTKFMAQTMQSLASARKTDLDRQVKLEIAAEKKLLAKVVTAAATPGGKAAGMTQLTVDFIRNKVLGGDE